MVQATEDGQWRDPPEPMDRSMDWGVSVQRQVSPELVVIRDVGRDDAAEVTVVILARIAKALGVAPAALLADGRQR